MVRSLLPRGLPDVRGLEVGAVYESSARVEVGGDVYDFLTLPDGQLAVVLGDARGHGIEATADMALAKFAFRSLVRLYPNPGELLAQVNEVALGELAGGNFVTMLCVTIHPETGEVLRCERGSSTCALARLGRGGDGARVARARAGHRGGPDATRTFSPRWPRAPLSASTRTGSSRRDATPTSTERAGSTQHLRPAASSPHRLSPSISSPTSRAFAGEPEDDYAVVVIRRTGG